LTEEEIQKRAESLKREEEQQVLSTHKKRGYRYAPPESGRCPEESGGKNRHLSPEETEKAQMAQIIT
jgi:hypothetical protein